MRRETLTGWLLVLALTATGRSADDPLTPEQHKLLQRATDLTTEATRFYQQGQLTQALECAREALRIGEKIFTKERFPQGHPDLARSLTNLAVLFQEQGDSAKARQY